MKTAAQVGKTTFSKSNKLPRSLIMPCGKRPLGFGAFGDFFALSSNVGVKVLRSKLGRYSLFLKKHPDTYAKFYRDRVNRSKYWEFMSDLNRGSRSQAQLRKSKLWEIGKREFKNQVKSYKMLGTMMPRPLRLVPVRIGNGWYPGIVMQRLQGETLASMARRMRSNNKKICVADRIKQLQAKAEERGVTLHDLHHENIIVTKSGKEKIIDFLHVAISARKSA